MSWLIKHKSLSRNLHAGFVSQSNLASHSILHLRFIPAKPLDKEHGSANSSTDERNRSHGSSSVGLIRASSAVGGRGIVVVVVVVAVSATTAATSVGRVTAASGSCSTSNDGGGQLRSVGRTAGIDTNARDSS